MILTQNFTKALKYYFYTCVFLYFSTLILPDFGLSGISSNRGDNHFLRMFLYKSLPFINTIAFWLSIRYITGEKRGTNIVILLHLAVFLITTYNVYFNGEGFLKSELYSNLKLGVYVFGIAVFGLMYFKDKKGLFMVFFVIVMHGSSVGFTPIYYQDFMDSIANMFHFRDIFEIQIHNSDNIGYKVIPYYFCLLVYITEPLSLIVFWWMICQINNKEKFDFKLLTSYLNGPIDKMTYFIIFWSFRVSVAVIGIGIVRSLSISFNKPLDFSFIASIISYCIGLYVIGSLFRNFLVGQFLRVKKHPTVLYLTFNIPFVNVIAWVVSLSTFQTKFDIFSPTNTTSSSQIINNVETNFRKKGSYGGNSNNGLKILIIVISAISIIKTLQYDKVTDLLMMFGLIQLILTVVFLYVKNAFNVLFWFSAFQLVLVVILQDQLFISKSIGASMFNLVFFYGLFFFDEIKWSNIKAEEKVEPVISLDNLVDENDD